MTKQCNFHICQEILEDQIPGTVFYMFYLKLTKFWGAIILYAFYSNDYVRLIYAIISH